MFRLQPKKRSDVLMVMIWQSKYLVVAELLLEVILLQEGEQLDHIRILRGGQLDITRIKLKHTSASYSLEVPSKQRTKVLDFVDGCPPGLSIMVDL